LSDGILTRIWEAQGLTHPMVVHFPIALFLAAALAIIIRPVFRRIRLDVIYFCLLVGTVGSILSTFAGWAWAPAKGYGSPFDTDGEIFWHRWGGVIVTIASVALTIWATRRIRTPERSQIGWQVGVLALAAAVGLVGHNGGELVHPGNFDKIIAKLSGSSAKPAPPLSLPPPPAPPTPTTNPPDPADPANPTAPAAPPTTIPASNPSSSATSPSITPPPPTPSPTPTTPAAAAGLPADFFAAKVLPILEAKCLNCHGSEKNKGKLRMHTEADSLAGGKNGPAYIKGNSRESLMIKLIVTDAEEDRMPPVDEENPITPEELAILTQWIDTGALWPSTTAAQP
jgi:uncharacterized membrane protein